MGEHCARELFTVTGAEKGNGLRAEANTHISATQRRVKRVRFTAQHHPALTPLLYGIVHGDVTTSRSQMMKASLTFLFND